jgi:uncharacterized protein with HEPN domain
VKSSPSSSDRQHFEADYKTYTSVIKTIEMIGESASRVSKEVQMAEATIPWKQLVGFRNRLIHVYWDIDFDIVWTVATEQMPLIRSHLQRILNSKS